MTPKNTMMLLHRRLTSINTMTRLSFNLVTKMKVQLIMGLVLEGDIHIG